MYTDLEISDLAHKKFRAVIKGGTYEFVTVWHGNGGVGGAFDLVELLQLTLRYQTTLVKC